MRFLRHILPELILIAVSGCTSTIPALSMTSPLVSTVHVAIDADGLTVASIQVRNVSKSNVAVTRLLNGVMDIRDTQGNLLVRTETHRLSGILEPGNVVFPTGWKGKLPASEYTLLWTTPQDGALELTFQIDMQDGNPRLTIKILQEYSASVARDLIQSNDYGGATLLVKLAKADLQQKIATPSDEILVRSVQAAKFSDASLGASDQAGNRSLNTIPGYIINLMAGNQVYKYHGANQRVVPILQ